MIELLYKEKEKQEQMISRAERAIKRAKKKLSMIDFRILLLESDDPQLTEGEIKWANKSIDEFESKNKSAKGIV